MHLRFATLRLFSQLAELLDQLSDEEYCIPIAALSGSTIGQHFRHVIECFQELEKGYHGGDVNYDLRRRDRCLETSRQLALRHIDLMGAVPGRQDKLLRLHAAFDEGTGVSLSSTYYRELLHNLDHTVHHMALIRVGLSAFPRIRLPESFGVAYSTLRSRTNTNPINTN